MMLSLAAVSGNAVRYSYNTSVTQPTFFGYGVDERYDVAIRLSDASLAGSSITGFTVDLPEGITAVDGWISTRLGLASGVNAPDGPSASATVVDGKATVSFDTPYVIPAGGVYVGYSFSSGSAVKPVAVVEGNSSFGLFMHASSSQTTWRPVASSLGLVSAMIVDVTGDFPDNAVSVEVDRSFYALSGKRNQLPVRVRNFGSEPVSKIGFASAIAGNQPVSEEVETALPAIYGATADITVPFNAPESTGAMPVTVSVNTVNGRPNEYASKTDEAEVAVIRFMPVNRPLVEEFTGTLCTFCPKGYVMMEEMNEAWGRDFIGLAYHNYSGDPMMVISEFPVPVTGLPSATCNRTVTVDPMSIPGEWAEVRQGFVPADIDVSVAWTGNNVLTATSSVNFAVDMDDASHYRLLYMLVEDGMSSPEWYQANGFSGNLSAGSGKWWDIFTKGGSYVLGLVYNDVVLGSSPFDGISGSVPAQVKAGEPVSHSYSFDISECIGYYTRQQVVQDRDKLRIVAAIIDTDTGRIVNSNTSAYAGGNSGIGQGVEMSGGAVVSSRYFDINGREVSAPVSGVNIRVDLMDDGTVRTSRIITR